MASKAFRTHTCHRCCTSWDTEVTLSETWKYDRSCPETGHIKIVPNGDEYPTVLAFNGYHYRVVGLWGIPGRLLWLELERFYGDTIVAATFCPDELMEMDLGMSDDEQLSAWLGGLPFLSVSPSEFNGSEVVRESADRDLIH